jgi:hypothetical protein
MFNSAISGDYYSYDTMNNPTADPETNEQHKSTCVFAQQQQQQQVEITEKTTTTTTADVTIGYRQPQDSFAVDTTRDTFSETSATSSTKSMVSTPMNTDRVSDTRILCAICTRQPIVPCMHRNGIDTMIICHTCLEERLKNTGTCPECGETAALCEFFPIENCIVPVLQNIYIKCPNSSAGCAMMTTFACMKEHLSKQCLFQKIHCDATGCQAVIIRKNMHAHRNTCKYIVESCKYCGVPVTRREMNIHSRLRCLVKNVQCSLCSGVFSRQKIEQHSAVCINTEMTCFKCGRTDVRRGSINTHWSTDCPGHKVMCNACSTMVRRSELEQHLVVCRSLLIVCPCCCKVTAGMNDILAHTATCVTRDVTCMFCAQHVPAIQFYHHSTQCFNTVAAAAATMTTLSNMAVTSTAKPLDEGVVFVDIPQTTKK